MLAVCALYAVSLAWLVIAALRAPLGYEDGDGFHLGEPECSGDRQPRRSSAPEPFHSETTSPKVQQNHVG